LSLFFFLFSETLYVLSVLNLLSMIYMANIFSVFPFSKSWYGTFFHKKLLLCNQTSFIFSVFWVIIRQVFFVISVFKWIGPYFHLADVWLTTCLFLYTQIVYTHSSLGIHEALVLEPLKKISKSSVA
jgi:hypothetical protein